MVVVTTHLLTVRDQARLMAESLYHLLLPVTEGLFATQVREVGELLLRRVCLLPKFIVIASDILFAPATDSANRSS